MRYIDIGMLKPGMMLGKSLYNENNHMLLKEGNIIKEDYIIKIYGLGYPGLYIMDEESEGIEIKEVISFDLRIDAVKKLKQVFIASEAGDIEKIGEKINAISALIEKVVDKIIFNKDVMINMVDLKTYSNYTYYHSVNVSVIAIAIGIGLGFERDKLYKLGMAAILHDIGKQFIPIKILDKPGPLTPDEFLEIKTHPKLGYEYIKGNCDIPASVYIGILQHHEKFDGSGYPHEKRGKDISIFGRILCIADVYDALISKRPYHQPNLPSDAVEYIMSLSGIMFDPVIVEVFLRKVAVYPVGCCVELSNGQKCLVVENFEDANLRPRVKCIDKGSEGIYINLKEDSDARNLTIIKMEDSL